MTADDSPEDDWTHFGADLKKLRLEHGRPSLRALAKQAHVSRTTLNDAELVHEAIALGLPSVMFDASRLNHHENVRRTREVVAACHAQGAWVEAELGEVGGKDGVHAPGARTSPPEAREFVAATGVDALAVAVGTSHAMLTKDATLDLD